MKEIPLTQGKFALVDDDMFAHLNQWKWYANKNHNSFYARRSVRKDGKVIAIQMHQQIIGKKQGFVTDHCDGDGLNNQCCNLRHVTNRQNLQNRIHPEQKSSKYPGVSWHNRGQKWCTSIELNGKRKHLGLYADEHEAFVAYQQAVSAIGESVNQFERRATK